MLSQEVARRKDIDTDGTTADVPEKNPFKEVNNSDREKQIVTTRKSWKMSRGKTASNELDEMPHLLLLSNSSLLAALEHFQANRKKVVHWRKSFPLKTFFFLQPPKIDSIFTLFRVQCSCVLFLLLFFLGDIIFSFFGTGVVDWK